MRRDLGALTGREHDLLVIGGGIYGAAAAWDAAQRGLAVALVEARDFGAGTSWSSLKTIHGGLRDLQRADFRQTRASIRERRAFLRIAPGLVRPLPCLVPTYGHGLKGREVFAAGLRLYDIVAGDRNEGVPAERWLPPSRLLSREEVLALFPGLPEPGLNGGAVWTDAQVVSSERLLLAFLHSASARGAVLANQAEVRGLQVSAGRVVGAQVYDGEGRAEAEVRARMVLNAAGAGMDAVVGRAGISPPSRPWLRAMNLVLKRPVTETHALGSLSGGRYLFLVPWRDRSLVGTAYLPDGPAGVSRQDAEAFLEEARRAFPWASLGPSEVALVHSGVVPGDARGLSSRPLVLDHEAEQGLRGLVSVQGVKYTGARAVAETAVDRVCRRLGRDLGPCRTAVTPLTSAQPLEGSLEEQTLQAVREEMALHLDDAVLRRLDLGTFGLPGPGELDVVARTMAEELHWDAARRRTEEDGLGAAAPYAAIPRDSARGAIG